MARKLSDNEIQDIITNMGRMLRDSTGTPYDAETPHGQTALATVTKVLAIGYAVLTISVEQDIERDLEEHMNRLDKGAKPGS